MDVATSEMKDVAAIIEAHAKIVQSVISGRSSIANSIAVIAQQSRRLEAILQDAERGR